jgi:hypothetical protein
MKATTAPAEMPAMAPTERLGSEAAEAVGATEELLVALLWVRVEIVVLVVVEGTVLLLRVWVELVVFRCLLAVGVGLVLVLVLVVVAVSTTTGGGAARVASG